MYDEMDINEQRSYDQYNDVRDVITKVMNNDEIPLSMQGLASAIADSLDNVELENLVSAIDLLQVQRREAEIAKVDDDYFKVKK